jgi:hypothetical protein
MFLQGLPVPQEVQARSAGHDEILRLLTQPPERIIEIFTNANRELNHHGH